MEPLSESNYEDFSDYTDYTDYPTYPVSSSSSSRPRGEAASHVGVGTGVGAGVGAGVVGHEATSVVQASSSGTKHVLFSNTSPATNTYHSVSTNGHRKASVNSHSSSKKRSDMDDIRSSTKVGIYGWRKRCLYLLILGLMVMVIVNLALTLWVLKVMEFSAEGMGQLRIVTGGVQLSGQAMVLDSLIASTISSRKGQPISIESSRNFTIHARDNEGKIANRIFLGNGMLECLTRGFRVTDSQGGILFSADRQEVVVGAQVLRVTGDGGAIFDGTVQTPLVRADSGNKLRLESPTRSLEVRAPQGIEILSRAGDISASCLTDLKLISVAGAIRLDSASIYLPNLKTATLNTKRELSSILSAQPPRGSGVLGGGGVGGGGGGGGGGGSSPPRHDVFQLCVCNNGKLFLAQSEGVCQTSDESRVCR